MSIDEQHVALPKLYGAPAYGRPRRTVDLTPRPFDPDDLPIEAYQTDEEREIAERLPGGESARANGNGGSELKARPFRLSALGRILRG